MLLRKAVAVSRYTLLVLLVLSCGGDSTGPEPDPDPDPDPVDDTPAALDATTPTQLAPVVGTSVSVGVIVSNADGDPLEGVPVSFAVVSGGGTITTAVNTGVDGRAAATWSLGTMIGDQEVEASVGDLPRVSFTAHSRSGPVVLLEPMAGDSQSGEPGATLAQQLSVRATDAYANPVSGAAVMFAVTSGGGSIAQPNSVTSAEGVALSGSWTLGVAGVQTASASSAGIAVGLHATLLGCAQSGITIGAAVDGVLGAGDCVLAGSVVDQYALTTTATAIAISLTATAFTPQLSMTDNAGRTTVNGDRVGAETRYCVFDSAPYDGCHSASGSVPGGAATLLAAAGTGVINVRAQGESTGGQYSLGVSQASADVSGCRTTFIQREVTTAQQLTSADCEVWFGFDEVYYSDDILLYVAAGTEFHVVMQSSAFTPWMDIFAPDGSYYAACVNAGAAGCRFTPVVSGFYMLAASSFEGAGQGAYALMVE